MSNFPKKEEIIQKMQEEIDTDNKNIKNQIKDLLKCDICNSNFDLNIHMPMVAKCGHTFCKKCIYNGGNKSSYGICPIDNIHHVLGIESCIPNLKLELIIKKIFNYTEPKITEKKIICFKHEIKLNNNSIDKFGDDKLFRSNSGNKNFFSHPEEFFPNILTDKKNKTITNFKVNKNNKINNLKLYNHNNVDVIEELNVTNDDKIKFTEENKINDESIDTIPVNDEKSLCNISFKDEFNELLNKNSDFLKNNSPKDNANLSTKEKNNENNIENNIENIKNENNLEIINKNNNENKIINNNENENDKNSNNNENINKENKEDFNKIENNNNENIINDKNNNFAYLQRNSINFIHKNKKMEIDAIDENDEYLTRPRTITVSKNNKNEEKSYDKDKNTKNNNINSEKKDKQDKKDNENMIIIKEKLFLKKMIIEIKKVK